MMLCCQWDDEMPRHPGVYANLFSLSLAHSLSSCNMHYDIVLLTTMPRLHSIWVCTYALQYCIVHHDVSLLISIWYRWLRGCIVEYCIANADAYIERLFSVYVYLSLSPSFGVWSSLSPSFFPPWFLISLSMFCSLLSGCARLFLPLSPLAGLFSNRDPSSSLVFFILPSELVRSACDMIHSYIDKNKLKKLTCRPPPPSPSPSLSHPRHTFRNTRM